MAVSGVSFGAQVDEWVRQTEDRINGVFRESAQEVIAEMQKVGPSVANPGGGEGGNMPVDTGFLRSTLQVGVNTDPVAANRPNPGGSHAYSSNVASVAIAGAEIGDTIVASYSAVYAPVIEYGGGNRVPRRFVGLAVAQWQAIVDRVTARLKARVAGRP